MLERGRGVAHPHLELLADLRRNCARAPAGSVSIDSCMCGGSENQSALPSSVYSGERDCPMASKPAAGDAEGAGAQVGVAQRRLEPDPVAGATGGDDQMTVRIAARPR